MQSTYANQNHGPAVETVGLTKRFVDRTGVDEVSLVVPRGAAYGSLGHNGAGKTTLIRMLLGLTRASAGSASVLGLPVPGGRAGAPARVGAIVEEPSFYPHLTGRENLTIAAAIRGPETRKQLDEVLHRRPRQTLGRPGRRVFGPDAPAARRRPAVCSPTPSC